MSEETEFIFNELRKDHPLFIGREEYGEIIGVSTGTIARRIRAGIGLPNYKRAGDWKNSRILFNLKDVAEFLSSQTTKTV